VAAILLLDGPLAKRAYEIYEGWPVPDRFAVPDVREDLQWYVTQSDRKTAKFDKTEPSRILKG
jgi:hypothetical protein